jgi:hypothetical protein
LQGDDGDGGLVSTKWRGADDAANRPRIGSRSYQGVLGFQMKKLKTDWSERKCFACNGTGFPAVKRLARPGRRIYPPPCAKCKGMGRIKIAAK